MSTFRIGLDDREILPEVFNTYDEARQHVLYHISSSHHWKIDIEERDENDDTVEVRVLYREEF